MFRMLTDKGAIASFECTTWKEKPAGYAVHLRHEDWETIGDLNCIRCGRLTGPGEGAWYDSVDRYDIHPKRCDVPEH